MAARSVRSPLVTGTTLVPSRRMRPTFGAWRCMSISPMYTVHGRPRRAQAAAGDAVLARAGLGDDAPRTEALGEQRLAGGIVDLVRAGVRQILAFQPHLCAPARRQARREGERGGSSHPGIELLRELLLEVLRVQVLAHAALQALERRDQGLGDVAPAERPEAAALVRQAPGGERGAQPRGTGQGLYTHTRSSLGWAAGAPAART